MAIKSRFQSFATVGVISRSCMIICMLVSLYGSAFLPCSNAALEGDFKSFEPVPVGSGQSPQILVSQLRAGNLVPEVVPALPEQVLDMRVVYNQVGQPIGAQMRLAQTQAKPHVELYGNSFGGVADKYTLVMVDPDAPSPSHPTLRNILHWLVADIPGSTDPSQEIWETGQELIHYMGPAPPEGLHRYVLLLFKQEPGQLFNKVPEVPESRVAFSLADFVKKYNLGIPVAGYYFRARHGD